MSNLRRQLIIQSKLFSRTVPANIHQRRQKENHDQYLNNGYDFTGFAKNRKPSAFGEAEGPSSSQVPAEAYNYHKPNLQGLLNTCYYSILNAKNNKKGCFCKRQSTENTCTNNIVFQGSIDSALSAKHGIESFRFARAEGRCSCEECRPNTRLWWAWSLGRRLFFSYTTTTIYIFRSEHWHCLPVSTTLCTELMTVILEILD